MSSPDRNHQIVRHGRRTTAAVAIGHEVRVRRRGGRDPSHGNVTTNAVRSFMAEIPFRTRVTSTAASFAILS